MSVEVKMIAGIPRLVEMATRKIAKSVYGKAIDGGRANAKHRGVVVARRQARHINEAMKKRHGGS